MVAGTVVDGNSIQLVVEKEILDSGAADSVGRDCQLNRESIKWLSERPMEATGRAVMVQLG